MDARSATALAPAATADERDAAVQLLNNHRLDVKNASGLLTNLAQYEPSLLAPATDWTARLDAIAREMLAAEIILEAGFAVGQHLPDSAEPKLQGLIRCRVDCSAPVYDPSYYVRVRNGRALVVDKVGTGGFDKHFFEWVGGTPMPPAPIAETESAT